MSIKSYALKDFQKHQEFTPICFPKRKMKFLFLFVTEFLEIKITQDLIFPIDHSWLSNNIENMPQLIQTFFWKFILRSDTHWSVMLPFDKRAKVLKYGWQVCHFILSTGASK
jgi:hypothetical protein